jgi:hypothetical protein
MSDYTKSTNFATKDNLSSGNPLKIVKGTEIDTEFNNIQTAIATKADLASPTFTGTVTIPTASVTTATISTATISAGTITGITDLAIADGGTGASTAANARTNLGLVIGTNVQAWDADLDTWATKTAPSGTVVGTSDTQTLTNKTLSTGTVFSTSAINTATAVNSTSGTSIDFTSIPSWVKRITVMFNGVSLSATANILVQLGTGSTTYTTTGYNATTAAVQNAGNSVNSSTAGFVMINGQAARIVSGHMIITNISGNNWISSHNAKLDTSTPIFGGGDISLGAVLTAVRITSSSTDTFDAGSINILYE